MQTLLENIPVIVRDQHGLAFIAVFVGGLISAVSPCVLAAIPLIIGYVGGYSAGSKKKAALYSLVFVFGLALAFTIMGAAAAAVGRFLWFMGKWLYIGLAAIAILMGLQLLGVVSLALPFQKSRKVRNKGLLGAFSLGLLTGIASSPCATPVLVVILAYVSTQGDLFYGSSLLFVYALGHCALIFVAGTSVGLTESFITSRGANSFSQYSRVASGVILVAVGIYLGVTNY